MAKLRIGVLYDFWWEDAEKHADDARPPRKNADEDVQEVYEALKRAGHNPVYLRLDGTPQSLIELATSESDLIFNLVESFGGDDRRDINVSVLGNDKPEALPIVELDLSKLPAGTPKIAGTEVKWEEDTDAYKKTKPILPQDLGEELEARLKSVAVQAFQTLQLRDYGRIDFRLALDGTLHVLEVNPNPYLLPSAEFCMAARQGGRSFPQLIDRIVEVAMARYANGGS